MKSFEALSVKPFFEKTFLLIILQGGHQSEPVNSTSTCLFSLFAFLNAASRSVVQASLAAVAKTAVKKRAIVVIIVFISHWSILVRNLFPKKRSFCCEGAMSSQLPRLIVATRNQKKTDEIRQMLTGVYEVVSVSDTESKGVMLPEIEEAGTTFCDNATLKAVGISAVVSGLVLADDSGLEVDGLNGEPGVWSSSYGGEEGNHMKNNARLERELPAVPESQRTGRFHCVMVLAQDGKVLGDFAGSVEGSLTHEPRGSQGFGYDPYFIPEGREETFAQLGPEVKNGMSHRGRALQQVVAYLQAEQ